MKTFAELNQKRQKAIQLLVGYFPEIKETGTVTLAQIKEWWETYSKNGSRDIGYPIWLLTADFKVENSKATYHVPLPAEGTQEVVIQKKIKGALKTLTTKKVERKIVVRTNHVISEDDFLAECKEAGVEV